MTVYKGPLTKNYFIKFYFFIMEFGSESYSWQTFE